MTITPLLLAIALLSTAPATAQKVEPTIYRCRPCGRDCDNAQYSAEGKCKDCGMELVPASTIRFTEIAPLSTCEYIKRNPEVVLLDVRTREEYEGRANPDFGTLKGAINIPVQELAQRISELQKFKGKQILVFCSHSHRSPQAAYILGQNGFDNVVNMKEGMSVLKDKTCKD